MIFVVGSHKSGTSLLRNLLDGHPALAVIPFETHLAGCFGIPVEYRLKRQTLPPPSGPEVRDRLLDNLTDYVTGRAATADADLSALLDGPTLDERVARCGWIPSGSLDAGQVDLFLRAAFELATGEAVRSRTVVEKSVENIEIVPVLLGLSPIARVIQITRDPHDNLASIRRTIVRRDQHYPPLRPLVSAIATATIAAQRNGRVYPDRVLTIRYEELVQDIGPTMEAVAAFLGIDFEESLLSPTVAGAPWAGNSSRSVNQPRLGQPVTAAADSKRDTALETEVLRYLTTSARPSAASLRHLLRCIRPAKSERVSTYVANRLLVVGAGIA